MKVTWPVAKKGKNMAGKKEGAYKCDMLQRPLAIISLSKSTKATNQTLTLAMLVYYQWDEQ